MKDVHHLFNLGVPLLDSGDGGVFVKEVANSSLGADVKEKQALDLILMRIKGDIDRQKVMAFEVSGNGTLWYQERLCVPDVDGLRERILAEAHQLY